MSSKREVIQFLVNLLADDSGNRSQRNDTGVNPRRGRTGRTGPRTWAGARNGGQQSNRRRQRAPSIIPLIKSSSNSLLSALAKYEPNNGAGSVVPYGSDGLNAAINELYRATNAEATGLGRVMKTLMFNDSMDLSNWFRSCCRLEIQIELESLIKKRQSTNRMSTPMVTLTIPGINQYYGKGCFALYGGIANDVKRMAGPTTHVALIFAKYVLASFIAQANASEDFTGYDEESGTFFGRALLNNLISEGWIQYSARFGKAGGERTPRQIMSGLLKELGRFLPYVECLCTGFDTNDDIDFKVNEKVVDGSPLRERVGCWMLERSPIIFDIQRTKKQKDKYTVPSKLLPLYNMIFKKDAEATQWVNEHINTASLLERPDSVNQENEFRAFIGALDKMLKVGYRVLTRGDSLGVFSNQTGFTTKWLMLIRLESVNSGAKSEPVNEGGDAEDSEPQESARATASNTAELNFDGIEI